MDLILATLALILLSAIWSGTESALFTVSLSKAKQLYAEGKVNALFLKLVETRDSYITTIVFNNNIVNIMGSMYLAEMAAAKLGSGLMYGIFSFSLTIAIIIFAEILPKAIGSKKSVEVMGIMGRPLEFARIIMGPLVKVVTKFADFIIRILFGKIEEESTSEADIGFLVQEGAEDINSEIRPDEAELIKRVFNMHDSTARDIMTPRTLVTYLNKDEFLYEAADKIHASQHSRIVVIGETMDDVAGFVLKEDLQEALANGDGPKPISDMNIRNPQFVSETTTAESLLKIFKRKKAHIAMVRDEFQGLSGIVTLEDVMEIVFGEIEDETDEVADMRDILKLRKTKDKMS